MGDASVSAEERFDAQLLSCAAELVCADVVRRLLNTGADVNARNAYSVSALHEPFASDDVGVHQIVLQKGTHVSAYTDNDQTLFT